MRAVTTEETMKTRAGLLALTAVLLSAGLCHAQAPSGAAKGYPDRPVRMVVPFAAGGPTDVTARLIAHHLQEKLGKQFYVENIAGAGGNTGTGQAARAAPDGYALLVASTGFVVNASLYAKIPYDPQKDFAPITLAAASPNVVTVHPSVPANSVKELVDLIKANPGKYSFAGPGTGSTPHLSGELFKLHFNLDLVHVPFTGAAPAITSTMGGHTPIAFTALPPAIAAIKDGKLRALALTSEQRVPSLPDVPTMAEAGVQGHEADTLTSVLAPAGTPKEIIDLLYREIAAIVAMPDVKEKLTSLGFLPIANRPDEFAQRIDVELKKWAKVIRDAKIPQIQ
jgi:tripartite-type tricarboxylate transporter receptor subunit TctC